MRLGSIAVLLVALSGCSSVGPEYHRPQVAVPNAYKENWKPAAPKDGAIRGPWWEMFGESDLNGLEKKLNATNPNIAAALASFLEARALVKEARAQFMPTVSVGPSASLQGGRSASPSTGVISGTFSQYSLPIDASWAPDLWGRVRDEVRQSEASAQAAQADLANVRLVQQAELAVDYYELRGQDSMKELLDATVVAERKSLELTIALAKTGIDSDEAVAQAETQLETTQAQDTNLGIARAQYEHAIAVLIGEPASSFALAPRPLEGPPPEIPAGLPSELLEQRPDVAAAERAMAAANAQIGVAQAAFYPSLTLNGSAGIDGNSYSGLLALPSFVWSVGASLAETVFDGGLRSATVEQYRASYQQVVATYRETVLGAFQQVEDDLASLRILSQQLFQQHAAVRSSQRYLRIATDRYRLGIDPYLDVLSAQITLLSNEQTEVTLRSQRMTSSVQLVEAVGGGWDSRLLTKGKGQ